jgi:tRNA pseudouridine38-40 synthase
VDNQPNKDRYQVHLAYDGTDFHGSQFQPELRTVQGEVETALRKLGWQERSILLAGRTDAGVHAAGQVIAFDLSWNHPDQELEQALNAVLPPDIAVLELNKTRQDFHPRYDALSREYHYWLFTSRIRDPLKERYSWRVWPELNLRVMKKASRQLIGTHDFAALGSPHKPGGSTTRKIKQVSWKESDHQLIFKITGNAFLYHMVRRIVMVLVKIGQNKESADVIKEYLTNPSGSPAQGLAPAQGLRLVEVRY